jgi:hypothetical protein
MSMRAAAVRATRQPRWWAAARCAYARRLLAACTSLLLAGAAAAAEPVVATVIEFSGRVPFGVALGKTMIDIRRGQCAGRGGQFSIDGDPAREGESRGTLYLAADRSAYLYQIYAPQAGDVCTYRLRWFPHGVVNQHGSRTTLRAQFNRDAQTGHGERRSLAAARSGPADALDPQPGDRRAHEALQAAGFQPGGEDTVAGLRCRRYERTLGHLTQSLCALDDPRAPAQLAALVLRWQTRDGSRADRDLSHWEAQRLRADTAVDAAVFEVPAYVRIRETP